MSKNLSKKKRVALVTGGGHGLGKEIALSLIKEGIEVIVCGRNKKYVENSFDATNPSEVAEFFKKVITKIGRLDILVNQIGGVKKFGNFLDLTNADWQEAWNLNFMTAVNFSRESIPWLKKSKMGRIINISTIPAHQPGQFNPHYSAAKAALLNLSKYLSNFLAKDNILVNTICPGTLFGGSWSEKVRDKFQRLNISINKAEILLRQEEEKKVPLGRICQLKDVADLVVFLASDKANFITGTCINIDGGVVKSIL